MVTSRSIIEVYQIDTSNHDVRQIPSGPAFKKELMEAKSKQ